MNQFLEYEQVKEEEFSYYPQEYIPYIPYENSNLGIIIAIILQMPQEEVDWIAENDSVKMEALITKSLRTLRRDRAKKKLCITPIVIQEIKKSKRGRKPLQAPDSDSGCDKKTVQMIRNRISAQNSRDRKKAYLRELESHAHNYHDENEALKIAIEELSRKNNTILAQNQKVQQCVDLFVQLCEKEPDMKDIVEAITAEDSRKKCKI